MRRLFRNDSPVFAEMQSLSAGLPGYDPKMFSRGWAEITRLFATSFLLPLPCVGAQAVQTADQRVRLQVYGLLSYTHPDFLGSRDGLGVVAGGNIDGIRVLPYLELGLDLRGSLARSDVLNETYLAGGPRISYSRYRLRPYAEYMFGLGRGGFNNPYDPDYTRDYTAIRSYGGGFDYRISTNVSLKADAQYQRWRFTFAAPYFHPVLVGVGISYRLHFRSRTGPQY